MPAALTFSKINDVLRGKAAEVVTVPPDATVGELVALLAEHNVGALIVSGGGKMRARGEPVPVFAANPRGSPTIERTLPAEKI